MAAVYYLDYLIFAPPIIAVTAWLGPWAAFALLAPLYFILDYLLGTITLSIVRKNKRKNYQSSGLLLRLINRWFDVYRDMVPAIEKRLSPNAGLWMRSLGFVFASYWGTAFLTMPAMYLLGQRKYLKLLTAASAGIYAITFVGQTAGLTFIGIKIIDLIF